MLQNDPLQGLRPEKGTYGKLAFEVKLTFFVLLGLFYPVTLCLLLHTKPTVQYWFGNWIGYVAIIVVVWVVICHIGMVTKAISKQWAPILMIIMPALLLVCVCQVQKVQFSGVGAALQSNDCSTTLLSAKSALDDAWWAAHELMDTCSKQLVQITGASLEETLSVTDLSECAGYDELSKTYSRDWQYLEEVESYYQCGGWCTSQKPIWTAPASHVHDSCSLSVARALTSSINVLCAQVTTQAIVLLVLASFAVLVSPAWISDL